MKQRTKIPGIVDPRYFLALERRGKRVYHAQYGNDGDKKTRPCRHMGALPEETRPAARLGGADRAAPAHAGGARPDGVPLGKDRAAAAPRARLLQRPRAFFDGGAAAGALRGGGAGVHSFSDRRPDPERGTLVTLFAAGLSVYALFCLLWGVYYFADDFAEKSGFENREISVEQLESVTRYFARLANEYAAEVPRDENGFCVSDRAEILRR